MAIKTLVASYAPRAVDLATASSYADETEYFFRSQLNRLRKTLTNPVLARLFVASYSHPSAKSNKHLTVLYELFDRVNTLESMYGSVRSTLEGMPKAQPVLDRLSALLESSKKRVHSALRALSKCVEQYQPAYFKSCHEGILAFLASHCHTYEKLEPLLVSRVVVDTQGAVVGTQFVAYFRMNKLADSSGYVHDKYYIAVSCLVNKHGMYTMTYSLQPSILLPGRFKSSSFFADPKDGYSQIREAMVREGFDWSTK